MTSGTRAHDGDWPLVSVVIPTRGRVHLLPRALSGILEQDYEGPIECLVVFDQSGPELPDLEPRADRHIEARANERTPGLAGARNTGVLAARGAVVAFCDDDDRWRPSKLRRQVELLRLGRHFALATCGISIRRGERTIERVLKLDAVTRAELLRSRLMEVHSSTFVADRALFARVGLIDEAIPGSYAEDYEWLLRATCEGSVAVVREALVDVHWDRMSWFSEHWATIAAAYEYLLAKHPDLELDRRGFARICGQIAFAHAAARDGRRARAWSRRSIQLNWHEPRAFLALLVGSRIVRADAVLRLANAHGRGI